MKRIGERDCLFRLRFVVKKEGTVSPSEPVPIKLSFEKDLSARLWVD
jgi:hypothetical protein